MHSNLLKPNEKYFGFSATILSGEYHIYLSWTLFLLLKLEAINETSSNQWGVYFFVAPTEQDEFDIQIKSD
ncbi:MAG: hypothetical protein ABI760_15415 [Ferruginibacter sp.]